MRTDLQELAARHDRLWQDPARAQPLAMFAWNYVSGTDFRLVHSDAQRSLEFSLGCLEKGSRFADDSLPMIRVEIGTGLVATAFGAELLVAADNLPAVSTHPIQSLADLDRIEGPSPTSSGLFPHVYRHIAHFRDHLPAGVRLCQCDLQGPWNSSHLLAGDKIFLDVYDDLHLVRSLLDRLTDFMVQGVREMKRAIGEPWDHFYLLGTKIPGASRLCNCSTDMVSADFYEQNILERDSRYFDAMGGGFMHICGNNPHCIPCFNRIPRLRGLEFNFNYLDLFKVADLLREDIVLICSGPVDPPLLTPRGQATLDRLCRGELPDKRNILFHFDDPADLDKCRRLYDGVHRR